MLTDSLGLYTEDLTSGDDDLEHDLEEPNLMHSDDFGDYEEAPCADVAEECTLLVMKMSMKMIVMSCIKTNDWTLDIFYNEKVDVNDDLASVEGDVLDTQDLDVPTTDAGEGL